MGKSHFQIFIENFVQSILSILKIVLFSKFRIQLPKAKERSCVILGNGPSLVDSILKSKNILINYDLFCVNHFAETTVFKELRPRNYILNAPEMWMDDVEEFYYKKGEKLFFAIAHNTTWEMTLFIPWGAKKSRRWQQTIKTNPQIKIYYFNTTPISGFSWFCHFCYRKNLGLMRPHNVLIPSLIITQNLKYTDTYIMGADHSWLKDIWVSDNNEVLLTQRHFYDKENVKAKPMDNLGKGQRRLHEILEKFVHAFSGYFLIEKYSQSLHQNIYNITPDSYIDAFKRINLSEIDG